MREREGVSIDDGRFGVRLTKGGAPNELGYPTIIEARAGPFQGSVLDNLLDYGEFGIQLVRLHRTLAGVARLSSYEGFVLEVIGNGRGIETHVRIVGEHLPFVELKFPIQIDQSYLPAIIEQVEIEFPPPYRVL